jgi:hypothetical protein
MHCLLMQSSSAFTVIDILPILLIIYICYPIKRPLFLSFLAYSSLLWSVVSRSPRWKIMCLSLVCIRHPGHLGNMKTMESEMIRIA